MHTVQNSGNFASINFVYCSKFRTFRICMSMLHCSKFRTFRFSKLCILLKNQIILQSPKLCILFKILNVVKDISRAGHAPNFKLSANAPISCANAKNFLCTSFLEEDFLVLLLTQNFIIADLSYTPSTFRGLGKLRAPLTPKVLKCPLYTC